LNNSVKSEPVLTVLGYASAVYAISLRHLRQMIVLPPHGLIIWCPISIIFDLGMQLTVVWHETMLCHGQPVFCPQTVIAKTSKVCCRKSGVLPKSLSLKWFVGENSVT